jgi:branched-chain amino acid transport system ATP-binding protein
VTTATAPILSVSGLRLTFGGIVALNDIAFDVWPRELFAVIGPNGAGKTTLLNCLSALYRPAAGSIRLGGTDLVGLRPTKIARLGVARTFQNLGLFSNLSVLSNILLGRHCRTRSGFVSSSLRLSSQRQEEAAQREFADEVIALLNLTRYRDQPIGILPYGTRKLVELGRALVSEPKLLLLDEPAAGMNLEETENLAVYLEQIRRRVDTSIILIEHDMQLVMDIADRVMVIDFGVRIATGTPQDIQRDEAVINAYLGRAVDPTFGAPSSRWASSSSSNPRACSTSRKAAWFCSGPISRSNLAAFGACLSTSRRCSRFSLHRLSQ